MEHIKTLTRIIDRQEETIKELKSKIDSFKLSRLEPNKMNWRGTKLTELTKEDLLEMNTYLFKLLADFNPDIRESILRE